MSARKRHCGSTERELLSPVKQLKTQDEKAPLGNQTSGILNILYKGVAVIV